MTSDALVIARTEDFELLRECYITKKGLNKGPFVGCEVIAVTWHHDNPICAHCKAIIDQADAQVGY